MNIRVLNYYQGKASKERPILAGTYAHDDPKLWGIADYLLEMGFAVKVDAKEEKSK